MALIGGIADPSTRAMAQQLASIQADVDQLKSDGRTTQLGNSTLMNGKPLLVQNSGGAVVAAIGAGVDAFTIKIMNGPPPSRPSQPTLTPFPSGVMVGFSGGHVSGIPEDYDYTKVYASTSAGITPTPANFAGRLYGDDTLPLAPYTGGTTVYVILASVNTSGKEGEPSLPVSAVAGQVVAQAVLDGIVGELALADASVKEAKLAGGAVTVTKISDGAVTSPKIVANGVQAVNIAADAVAAGKIAADAVTAREIRALAVTAGKIDANAVTAGTISAGSVTAAKMEANMLLTTRIVVGSLTAGRIQLHPTQGLELYKPDGTTRTGWWDPATGNIWTQGQYSTAGSGTRIVINPGAAVPDEMRFYQGNNYGYINAEPAPGGTAAVVGRSQAGSNSRGSFGCYPSEGFVALTNAGGTVSEAAFSAVKGAANIWGGQIALIAREEFGSGDTVICARRSDDSYRSSREIRFILQGVNGEPSIWGSNQNVKLVFANGSLIGQVNNSALCAFVGASFTNGSSRTIKKREKRIALRAGPARTALMGVEPKSWLYEHEHEEGEEPVAVEPTKRRDVRRDRRGRVVFDEATGEPIIDEVTMDQPVATPTKPHFFPIAEDLLEVLPELVNHDPNVQGGLTVDIRDVTGFLWKVSQEQETELRALRAEINALKKK